MKLLIFKYEYDYLFRYYTIFKERKKNGIIMLKGTYCHCLGGFVASELG